MGAKFTPPSPVPTAFELGGRILFGKKPRGRQRDKRLSSETYIGIDTTDPDQNYFYSRLEATVEKLLHAFGFGGVPGLWKDTGFPDGLEVSGLAGDDGSDVTARTEMVQSRPRIEQDRTAF